MEKTAFLYNGSPEHRAAIQSEIDKILDTELLQHVTFTVDLGFDTAASIDYSVKKLIEVEKPIDIYQSINKEE